MSILHKPIKILFVAFLAISSSLQLEAKAAHLEKIYTQTDRPFYFPGETIWFKSYLVNADNTVSTLSDVVYANLISPQGSVMKTLKLKVEQGCAHGEFLIQNDWVGGIYKIEMFTNWMQNYGKDSFFTKNITVQKIVKPNVLLSLEFEKEGYGKSSWVTAHFEAKDLKNNPLINTEVLYRIFTKGEEVISQKINTSEEGKADLKFQLPSHLATRDVVLNVQIHHKGTVESISRSVPVVLDNIDLQFLPESGKLLYGAENRVAFKAIDEFGKPVDVEGAVFDEGGKLIASFSSFHDGMGAFELNPALNTTYYATLKAPFVSEKKIALPKVHQKGVNFRVEIDSLSAKIKLHHTIDRSLSLKISNAGQTLLERQIKSNQNTLQVDTRTFPIGITKFSVVDENQTPLAERLVFVNAHKQLKVEVALDKEIYQTREKVKVTLITKDENDTPIPSNLSVAVADNKLLSFADDKQDHILSYLLLSSELKGKIHKPSFYFNPEEEKSYEALDYVMLTHGWRDYLAKQLDIDNVVHKPEQFTTYLGAIRDKKNRPIQANLLLFDSRGDKVLFFKSDKNGKFSFKSDIAKNLTLIAYTEKGEEIEIIGDEAIRGMSSVVPEKDIQKGSLPYNTPSKFNNPTQQVVKQEANKKEITTSLSLVSDDVELEEILVFGYGALTKKSLTGSVWVRGSNELNGQESVAQLLQGRIAGVRTVNSGGMIYGSNGGISLRGSRGMSGNGQPIIIIDGIPYDSESLVNLNPNEIESVTLLRDAGVTEFSGGVLVVTTKHKNFQNNWGKKKLNKAKYNNYAVEHFPAKNSTGLYYARQFYAPKYESKELPQERNDFRQTIYWNPIVQTDENGKAEFEFYNSDAITSFQILAEGVGYNGLLGRQKTEYATKKLLSVDFKSPNYMVLNDTVMLPVTITNETNEDLKAKLQLSLPKELELLEPYNQDVVVRAYGSVVQHLKVMPVRKATEAVVGVELKSDKLTDFVARKVTVLSPYFPTKVSVSGAKSQSFEFSIDNFVQGSLQVDFTIYTDIVGDVMDGIEGILREPYGCFEQVSSSTYPNILVLKYLKETNKSNPAVEERALDLIKKGYKQLAAYETAQDGFEWYGGTPPHEALTAYGLMQFTEMKEVFDGVSEPMLNRTLTYLLKRRDGKGGFKQNRGKYGFSAAPENVNNAYIVYAISESGIKVDIETEYKHTFEEALESNDTYRMALMACASFNFDKKDQAKQLIGRIKKNIEKYDFSELPVAHTITRSYGNAKNIETVAFSLLALLKEDSPDEFLISQGVEYLVSKRSHSRFGSTQSTSMALKALIEYTKAHKIKLLKEGDAVELIINGKKLEKELSLSETGKVTLEDIGSYMTEGNQNVVVKFSNPEVVFPYSLNVNYDSFLPKSSDKSPLALETLIADRSYSVGDNVSMTLNIANKKSENLGMVTAVIGIPSGTTPQPWQLKKLVEEDDVAYYEVFDNYLVFYWRSFRAEETQSIRLDLKADIAGRYQAPASTVYLYYGDEFKTWEAGSQVTIE